MSVTESMTELRAADTKLRESAVAYSEVAGKKDGDKEKKDALSRLRSHAKAFAVAERNARSAKLREVKAIDL